jgi:hypothetical protein
MRVSLFVLLTLSSSWAIAQDVSLEKVGESPVETKFAPGGQIRMDLCPGGIELIGRDENVLRVSYYGRGEWDNVKVQLQVMGNHADLKVTGCPHNNFQMTIEVPKTSNLYVRMFAGQLGVSDVAGDKDVELHAGQLTIDVGKSEDYFRVDASVFTGDLQASAFNISKSGLFRSFEQGGPGKYRLHAHVGAGQIELR